MPPIKKPRPNIQICVTSNSLKIGKSNIDSGQIQCHVHFSNPTKLKKEDRAIGLVDTGAHISLIPKTIFDKYCRKYSGFFFDYDVFKKERPKDIKYFELTGISENGPIKCDIAKVPLYFIDKSQHNPPIRLEIFAKIPKIETSLDKIRRVLLGFGGFFTKHSLIWNHIDGEYGIFTKLERQTLLKKNICPKKCSAKPKHPST